MRCLHICLFIKLLSFSRLYALLYIESSLAQYCVIVIACVIIPYEVHTPCVGSTHAIFAMYCTAMLWFSCILCML